MIQEHLDKDIRIDNRRCAGIILKHNSILMMYRNKFGKEFYILPGGHMRQGETPLETFERELEEETSIKVKEIVKAFDLKDHYREIYEYYFICKWESGMPKLGGEELQKNTSENIYRLEWISFEDVKNTNLLPKTTKDWIQEVVIEGKLTY